MAVRESDKKGTKRGSHVCAQTGQKPRRKKAKGGKTEESPEKRKSSDYREVGLGQEKRRLDF